MCIRDSIVTDKNGCSKSAVFVLSNPAEIQLSGVVTNTYCNKALGGVVLTVLNGSAPFTYSWSNGQSSKNLTNVSSGSYLSLIHISEPTRPY